MVADTLRRAHLLDGVTWSWMAVLVRSATRQVPLLRRALMTAGVPAWSAGDELPLAEPGVRPLLLLLRCALHPETSTRTLPSELLTGPLGGTDIIGVRRLRRALRIAAHEALTHPDERDLTDRLRRLTPPSATRGRAAGRGADRRRELVGWTQVALPAERLAKLVAAPPRPYERAAPRRTCCGRSGTPPAWP